MDIFASITSILESIVTIIATILTIYAGKKYVDSGVTSGGDLTKPNLLRRLLLKFYGYFQVSNAYTFRVRELDSFSSTKKAFIDPTTELMITEVEVNILGASFEYKLPNHNTVSKVSRVDVGWREFFNWDGSKYALTLIAAKDQKYVEFDFRLVDERISKLHE